MTDNVFGIDAKELSRLYDHPEFKSMIKSVEEHNARFKDLPDAQKFLALALIVKGRTEEVPNLWRLFYRREVPTIEQYLTPDWIGDNAHTLYPQWRVDIKNIFQPESAVYEVIMTGAIGTGKSTASYIAHGYNLNRILSLRNPQMAMGSAPAKPMNLQFMTVTKEKAHSTLLVPLRELLKSNPYNVEVDKPKDFLDFKHDTSLEMMTPWCSPGDKILFPNNIKIVTGSQDYHALGEDLFGASLDEAEFRRGASVDRVFELYAAILERIRSRFLGTRSILMTLVSSVQHETGVMATHIKKIPAGDPHTHVAQYSIWEVKFPKAMERGHFYVVRGTRTHPSRVLKHVEIAEADIGRFRVPPGCELIKVPTMYRKDFETNVERALRNLAGKYTITDEKPFDDLTGVPDEHLMPELSIMANLKATVPLLRQLPSELFTKSPSGMRLKRYPNIPRYMHCDLADTGEAGLAMVHKELSNSGQVMYVVDFALRVISQSRISLELVNNFLMDLARVLEVNIHTLTADQYQSTGTLQLMETERIAKNVKRLSVDRTLEPYNTLSSVIAEGALAGPSSCPYLTSQLENIYFDKGKPWCSGRKDVADAVCGAVFNAVVNTKDRPINVYEDYAVNSEVAVQNLVAREGLKPL